MNHSDKSTIEEDDKYINIIIQYKEISKNYTLTLPKNIKIGEIIQELSEAINKSPQTMFLYKDGQFLQQDTYLASHGITDKGTVLQLQISSKGGFVVY